MDWLRRVIVCKHSLSLYQNILNSLSLFVLHFNLSLISFVCPHDGHRCYNFLSPLISINHPRLALICKHCHNLSPNTSERCLMYEIIHSCEWLTEIEAIRTQYESVPGNYVAHNGKTCLLHPSSPLPYKEKNRKSPISHSRDMIPYSLTHRNRVIHVSRPLFPLREDTIRTNMRDGNNGIHPPHHRILRMLWRYTATLVT